MQYESERIEYKSQMIDDIYKEVIAFANTDGGVIYLGIDDKGNLIGIDNVDETYTRLTNGIRDAIAPDVTMFVRYVLQDNKVIRIEVGEGSYKPYYLKSKGKTFSLDMISGLEAYAIGKAIDSKRYKVENTVNPKLTVFSTL